MKKPMSQKNFLEGMGDQCPNCGGFDLAGDPEWNADSGVVSRKVNCGNCNAEWVEFYELAGYDNLKLEDESVAVTTKKPGSKAKEINRLIHD